MLSRPLAALTATLLLSLTACSGSDEPVAEETGGNDSGVPGYADNPGEAGAEQFLGFWTDTLNEATTSGETEDLKALATEECTGVLGLRRPARRHLRRRRTGRVRRLDGQPGRARGRRDR